jgi:hypothetical protein
MWLVENKAILTNGDMIKRNWGANPTCYFCEHHESIDHLFTCCPTAKFIWGVVALCIGASNIPNSVQQIRPWLTNWLPGGGCLYIDLFSYLLVRLEEKEQSVL